jgi:hypothetical protein
VAAIISVSRVSRLAKRYFASAESALIDSIDRQKQNPKLAKLSVTVFAADEGHAESSHPEPESSPLTFTLRELPTSCGGSAIALMKSLPEPILNKQLT